jgi:membrane-bound lytic murein transglycosylase A
MLAACAVAPPPAPTPPSPAPPPSEVASPGLPVPQPAAPLSPLPGRPHWVPVAWSDLPGWDTDRTSELWPALLRSCERAAPEWTAVCGEARQTTPASDAALRDWLQRHLRPFRVSTLGKAGYDGLATGYFEPLIEASRVARGPFRVPLYRPAPEQRRPFWTRQQIDTLPTAQAALRGRELAFVADPLDALILQIQGSGRLLISESDGTRRLVRAAFAGHNEQPYNSVGRWLVEQGELKAEQASWPAIKAWARMNPSRLNELLWSNPRVVFFREEPLPDASIGPRGGQGVPLTPGRSIAVDTSVIPYGTPVWLDTTEPLSNTPLRRAVMAQDTGSAIVGAVRADYFWGWGEQAELRAGKMKQPLRLWVLWPRS